MDSRQANKKLRLSSGSSKNYFNDPYHSSNSSNKYSTNDEEFELWGDDLAVDDDLIQKIETQGYSQYQNNDIPKVNAHYSEQNLNNEGVVIEPSGNNDSLKNLQLEIQMKSGEAKNLRIEMENKAKEFRAQLNEKDAIIEDLRKQLTGKQSEIDFQKIEKLSQICKTPKSATPKLPTPKPPQNMNSSFHERFIFGGSKNVIKEPKVLNFSRPMHQGDILFKLLHLSASSNSKNKKMLPDDNEFILNVETYLLHLCRCSSFDQLEAQHSIKLILNSSKELLIRFHEKLCRKEINVEIANRKSKMITLLKTKDTSLYKNEESLLMNTKLTDTEKAIPVRWTITMLAKLINVHSSVTKLLIEPDNMPVSNCSCSNSEKVSNMSNLFNSSLRLSSPKSIKLNSSRPEEEMETDDQQENRISRKKFFVFDVVELVHDIIQEITVRGKTSKYESLFSSILHLYSVLCSSSVNIYEKQFELIISSLKKILFSLPGFVVVQYIIDFLGSSVQFGFSNSLCCRSAAETFSENFKYFSFTKDTCMLQVICAYIEMAKKTRTFTFSFVSWVSSLTSTSHGVKWLSNKTDSKFCECLLMLEQITIRIMLCCVNQYNTSKTIAEKTQTKSLLCRSVSIFQQFRWQDNDFELHISTCRGEYRILLQYLRGIIDDEVTIKFVTQELELTNVSQKYDLTSDTKNEIIDSMLKVFAEDSL